MQVYDVIIVGYGTTSSCIVEQLKRSKKDIKVLIINQGPLIEDDNVKYLKNFNTVWKNPTYTTIVGVSETDNNVTQGRIMGGSSMHNGCVAIKPSEHFKRAMNVTEDDIPIEVNATEYEPNLITDAISKLYKVPTVLNHNNYNLSVSPTPRMFLKRNGVERSMVTSLLNDIPDNFEFIQGYANKVNFERNIYDDLETRSIDLTVNGQTVTFYSDTIVISCGVNSSTILERSGIGSESILEKANIECLLDNPNVGEHVKNQVGPSICLRLPKSVDLKSNNLGIIGMGFLPSLSSISSSIHVPHYSHSSIEVEKNDNIRKYQMMITKYPYISKAIQKAFKLDGCTCINMCDLAPESSGYIHIVDSNPETQPLINLNTYGSSADIESGGKSLMSMYNLYEDIKSKVPETKLVFPTQEMFSSMSVKEILDIDSLVSEHYTSSCRMGKYIDSSVVNMDDHTVHGTVGLHVCDASIFPHCPDGNPQYSCMLLGMKFGDVLSQKFI